MKNFTPRFDDKDIEPAQIRAARGLVGWTRSELAKETGLSAETIKNTEQGTYHPKKETVKAITDAFKQCGIRFTCSESTITLPTDNGEPDKTLTFYHTSITCVTASVSDVEEDI